MTDDERHTIQAFIDRMECQLLDAHTKLELVKAELLEQDTR